MDTNALVLPARDKKKKKKKDARNGGKGKGSLESASQRKAARKRESKREKKRDEEHERKRRRSEALASLERERLPDEYMRLLGSSSRLGQMETQKERLVRELRMERSGIEAPSTSGGDNENDNGKGLYARDEVEGRQRDETDDEEEEENEDKKNTTDNEREEYTNERRGTIAGNGDDRKVQTGRTDYVSPEEDEQNQEEEGDDEDAYRPAAPTIPDASSLWALIQDSRAEIGLHNEEGGDAAPKTRPRVMDPHPSSDECAAGPACVVHVSRPEHIQSAREQLPIVSLEQEIVEAVSQQDILVLCGETGSGKTTQLPQFLYEAGYGCARYPHRAGMIGVTQPRRIAATSTAARVAEELGKDGVAVGYQIRHDRRVHARTSIKFMTDGILLRELQADFLLSAYSVIIIDEAHERTVNTDVLIGLLSRVVPMRRRLDASKPLKLIVMSATLRVEDFTGNTRLFPMPPPLLTVPARQYPVTVHFSRRTELKDYVAAVQRKAVLIHKRLPPGGILVFVTGQREVEFLCRQLTRVLGGQRARPTQHKAHDVTPVSENSAIMRRKTTKKQSSSGKSRRHVMTANDGDDEEDGTDAGAEIGACNIDDMDADGADAGVTAATENGAADVSVWEMAADDYRDSDVDGDTDDGNRAADDGSESESDIEEDWEENDEERKIWGHTADDAGNENMQVEVLPLYAMLPDHRQKAVFAPCDPVTTRRIVVATNVAETSLTIPGIRYVVDSGRSKQAMYDVRTGMARFEVRWISQASAEQRAGRSGRTGPGHCYRVYSSPAFVDIFPKHAPPEMCSVPLEGVLLNMKAMGIERVANFPFPSPPPIADIASSERVLVSIGALDTDTKSITDVGRLMSRIPVSPRHSRTLVAALDADRRGVSNGSGASCLQHAFGVVAALASDSPLLHDTLEAKRDPSSGENDARKKIREARKEFRNATCEALGLAAMLVAFERQGRTEGFCRRLGLHMRSMREMSELRRQLASTASRLRVFDNSGGGAELSALPVSAPTAAQQVALRAAICSGWADRVARRIRSSEVATEKGKRSPYRSCALHDEVFIHPQSPANHSAPDFLVYAELVEKKRKYMYRITAVEPKWLASCASSMVSFSSPLEDPPPWYDAKRDAVRCWRRASYGPDAWPLPLVSGNLDGGTEACVVFAIALLKGRVMPQLAFSKDTLVLAPETMLKVESRGHPCVKKLLKVLIERTIVTRASLQAMWAIDTKFLLPEIRCWLQPIHARTVDSLWPKLTTRAT